jgi:hypothetical protein
MCGMQAGEKGKSSRRCQTTDWGSVERGANGTCTTSKAESERHAQKCLWSGLAAGCVVSCGAT